MNNGILIVNKEKGMTSRDVVNRLNKIFNTKKIGHTGTLDPIAEGVLVTCIGSYTKLVDMLTSLEKEYIAEFEFGYETDTLDNTGIKINEDNKKISKDELVNILNSFVGEYNQQVPKYSAVKINGKKLYEYAREKIDIELPSRLVNIHNLELLEFNDNKVVIKTKVSKGTYIRSLIRDIAYELDTYATMTKLIRTKQGKFNIENSYSLNDIENNNYELLSLSDIFDYPIIDMDDEMYFKVKNGRKVILDNNSDYILFKYQGKEVAIYQKYEDTFRMYIYLEK
ncbi:MAG: tRNA pseudouridine(55) synthase TruB [Bacilli bacterium]|nr:tRNA pseudouridine(55) synthase TruB [Bacilli bacterium]